MLEDARFLFDTDFSKTGGHAGGNVDAMGEEIPPPIPQKEHEKLVADAFEEGRSKGHADGVKQRLDEEMERLHQLIAILNEKVGHMLSAQDVDHDQTQTAAVGLANLLASKLSIGLLDRLPQEAVTEFLKSHLAQVGCAKQVTIRVNEEDVDWVKAKVEEMSWNEGLEGRLITQGEAGLPHGSCQLEWADGAISQCPDAIRQKIDKEVAAFLDEYGPSPDLQQSDDLQETEPADAN